MFGELIGQNMIHDEIGKVLRLKWMNHQWRTKNDINQKLRDQLQYLEKLKDQKDEDNSKR